MKTVSRGAALLLVCVLVITLFTGCSKYAGTYQLTKITAASIDVTDSGLFPQMKLELGFAGRGTLTVSGNSFSITWKQSGDTLTIVSKDLIDWLKQNTVLTYPSSDSLTFIISGSNLTFSTDSYGVSVVLTFSKQ